MTRLAALAVGLCLLVASSLIALKNNQAKTQLQLKGQ